MNSELIHRYSPNHVLMKCAIADLFTTNIKKWKYNRPPDIERCREIAQSILSRRPAIDWMFYAIYENSNDTIYLLDGLHRFTALQLIHDENGESSGNDISHILSQHVIISIRIDVTDGEAIDLFQQINKSNPVPELYLQNADQDKKTVIEEIANKWMTNYRGHFSTNPRPNVPNTNRDRFIEFLDSMYQKMELTRENGYKLNNELYKLNEYMLKNPPPKLSAKTLEKCQQSGCYLFIVKPDVLLDILN
jgi:hypothetical protein